MPRKPGYYFVNLRGFKEPAQWTGNTWRIIGSDKAYQDKHMTFISKHKLKSKRTLYLKQTTNAELHKQWGFNPLTRGTIYVRCDKKGNVNWDKTSVYDIDECLVKNNIKIIK